MRFLKSWKGIVLIVVAVVLIYSITAYNRFVSLDVTVQNKWSEVNNNYQRRMDLIPNLVNVVKGGAEYEKNLLQAISEARAKAAGGTITAEKYDEATQAQNHVANIANSMIIRVENYPEIKGTKAFIGLQSQLVGTERRIKIARNDFNESVQNYNTAIRSFPGNVVAGLLGFKSKEGFGSEAGADKAVEIKF